MFFLLRNDAEAQNVVGTCKCDVADDSHLASLINDKCRIFGLRDVKKMQFIHTVTAQSAVHSKQNHWNVEKLRITRTRGFLFIHVVQLQIIQ